MNPDFIGAGWAFPVTTDATGGIALVVREREVEQAIRLILGTASGERPMRPEFGCRIHDHVFGHGERRDGRPDRLRRPRGAGALGAPHRRPSRSGVDFDGIEAGKLYVDVGYAITGSNDPRNLVFPFYVIPDQRRTRHGRSRPTMPVEMEP